MSSGSQILFKLFNDLLQMLFKCDIIKKLLGPHKELEFVAWVEG